mmetsp:Transcript_29069/g.81344  ORF Transcript_29069/g.81344 Transcript_29069/m.81344 type:complete len:293 (-) Transcript_29069:40-918(-)
MYKDRTNDFLEFVCKISGSDRNALEKEVTATKISRGNTTFHGTAQRLARQIGQTAGKLKKLASLAKKKSLFDDPTVEINELSYVIKKDIRGLQVDLEEMERVYGKGTRTQSETHVSNVVGSLDSCLGKTVKEFSQILEERSHNLQEQHKQRTTLVGADVSAPTSASLSYGALFEEASKGEELALVMDDTMQLQETEMRQHHHQESQLTEVQNIERILVDLQGIFTKVNELIMDHDVVIGRIDRDIDDAADNVWQGHEEVMDYWRNMSMNRWLYAKIFMVLVVFITLFIVFFL